MIEGTKVDKPQSKMDDLLNELDSGISRLAEKLAPVSANTPTEAMDVRTEDTDLNDRLATLVRAVNTLNDRVKL